jgi:hypothetical protein
MVLVWMASQAWASNEDEVRYLCMGNIVFFFGAE